MGTNDLHGAIDRLPVLAGYVANLRAARAADGGGVVLVDGGDLFQGTLASNLGEGADIVRAYNALGYAAAAVGNHEFDYGPEGPASTVVSAGGDPRGAFKARAQEAKFPFLVANLIDTTTGARIAWPNTPASTMVEVAGIKVGIVGALTESTPYTTLAVNLVGLRITPPASAIVEEAARLRAQGAQVVIAAMHIGTICKDTDHADDASSCDRTAELFKVLADLPRGTVDAVVAGHLHAGVAHQIDGVPVIESFSIGRAFGRIDLEVSLDASLGASVDGHGPGKVTASHVFPPHPLCAGDLDSRDVVPLPAPVAGEACVPGTYEGKPVVPDPAIRRIADEATARARERRSERLGVTLRQPVTRAFTTESAEGDWFADLLLIAHPEAQVSLINVGLIGVDLPAGDLTYGQLFDTDPFDNAYTAVDLTGADLRKLVQTNLQGGGAGFLSWGGLTAKARCKAGALDLQIRIAGKPLRDDAHYKLATSDYVATGGAALMTPLKLPDTAIHLTGEILRDVFAGVLRGWKATPKAVIDPARWSPATGPRIDYVGKRPIACAAK
ncbi:MAG TPA: 5'-nucleotidase C-terminal domain-containing protein [Kofleriaceae bacterium]|nr:5'-nucleotidase C-terminal domain-containing protein [Kofleriaceae bacterium]